MNNALTMTKTLYVTYTKITVAEVYQKMHTYYVGFYFICVLPLRSFEGQL